MIISRIKLHNFRIYKGDVSLDFKIEDGQNVILIFGENGFGKTTFLHALLWCLYGKMIIDVDDSIKKNILDIGYKSYLERNLNNTVASDRTQNMTYSVSIEFKGVTIPSVPCRSLIVNRSYDYTSKIESVNVLIDGHENELAKQIGYDLFINDFILNKDIARLFFFDSEQVVKIAEDQSANEKTKLSNAYNQVLGVKKYEDLKTNLINLRQKYIKAAFSEKEQQHYNLLNETVKQLEQQIDCRQAELLDKTTLMSSSKERYHSISVELIKEGSNVTVEDLNRAVNERSKYEANNIQLRKRLNGFLELAPFAIAGKLLKRTKDVIEHDYTVELSKQNFDKQNEVVKNIQKSISDFLNKYQLESDIKANLKEGIAKILTQYSGEVINEDTLLNIRKDEYDGFMSVYHHIKGSYQLELNNLIDDYKQNKIKIDKLNRKIHQAQIEASDNHINNLKTESAKLHQKITSLEKEISEINQEIGNLKAQLAKTNEALIRYQHRIQVLKSDADKSNLTSQLIEELDIFLKNLKHGKNKSLSINIKKILNSLMHKDGFIQDVQIDDEGGSLNISLINSNGEEIKKNSLSKGEQQLYASALLQALVEESGIEFPVFIDSPLQKFDDRHTNTIITKFYPNISKQVVLFPIYGKELTNNEYELLAPIVSEQYEIKNTVEGSKIIKVNQCSHRLGLAR